MLAEALLAAGADVERDEVAPGRPNLVARFGRAPRPDEPPDARAEPGGVLFLGHSDVVPAGPGWTGDPFEPRRDGDTIIGRGTTDMRGGLAAVVHAMRAVHACAPELAMTLVCTVDEEVDATGALHHIAHAPRHRFSACLVAEPTGLVTITGCRGATNLRIDVAGASAHAGRPASGASAILAATDVVAAIEADHARLAGTPHEVLGAATWSVGTIEGGHGTSIVPDRCTLSVDRRNLPGEEPGTILADLLADARARIGERARPGTDRIALAGAVEMTMPGFVTDPDSALVTTVRDVVRSVGGTGDVGVWTAACEGGFLAAHHEVPTLVLGPGDVIGQAHQPDERVAVSDLLTAARAYALIALRSAHHHHDDAAAPMRASTATLTGATP
ncbi:acetylornithine deacetylase [Pseudoclavibacter chungangensis]|uniref:M20 family metallopeptidase n=1 Tax=Pseudoclavibacter chungangensis TaxID=587635 RepID=UPI0017924E18|nr:M20 family metallopeptidase [Pseudoclavibacter chungangensis]NYJ65392.1 acetylornithine deacetylase [Pseudoclavibacter chungangensis]